MTASPWIDDFRAPPPPEEVKPARRRRARLTQINTKKA